MTDNAQNISFSNEILRGVVGSTAHGLAIEGQDDRDEMGVFIEPIENVCGLKSCDHYVYRTQPKGVRSGPGDLDLTLYSLRKFVRLATQGNPTAITLLWLSEYLQLTPLGQDLINLRTAFISAESGRRFLGYLRSQQMRLTGERTKQVSRPDLVEKYGFDTKFAMHALRLGYEGLELITNNSLTLPIKEPWRSTLRGVRTGQLSFEETLRLINDSEEQLRYEVSNCDRIADIPKIERFLVESHQKHWNSNNLEEVYD